MVDQTLSIPDLVRKSLILEEEGRIAEALQTAKKAQDLAKLQVDAVLSAQAQLAEARIRFRLGQYETARTLASLTSQSLPTDSPLLADAWQVIANCAAETNSLVEAEEFYRQAADQARECGIHRALIAALHGLSTGVFLPRGQFSLVVATEIEVRNLIEELGLFENLLYPLTTLAIVYTFTRKQTQASQVLRELSTIIPPDSIASGYHLYLRASLALDNAELSEANVLLSQALSVGNQTGEPWLNVRSRLGMSRKYLLEGDYASARNWADDALTYATRVGYHHEQANALIERARVCILGNGLLKDAENDLQKAIEILNDLQARFDLVRAKLLLAVCASRQGSKGQLDIWAQVEREIHTHGYEFILETESEMIIPTLTKFYASRDLERSTIANAFLGILKNVPPRVLSVITLGEFNLKLGRYRISGQQLRSRRSGELLGLLLLAPRHKTSVEQVYEALFPGKDMAGAQSLFHQATSHLRKLLEPDLPEKYPSRYLMVENGWVFLSVPEGSWIDWVEFEKYCQLKQWESALNLYNGEFLPDYRYADWAVKQREWINYQAVNAFLEVARDKLNLNLYADALALSRKALVVDPWQEQAALLAMRSCLGRGDRIEAIRIYLELADTLQNDLGIEPCNELRELYQTLL